jgi:hypothetical protein
MMGELVSDRDDWKSQVSAMVSSIVTYLSTSDSLWLLRAQT